MRIDQVNLSSDQDEQGRVRAASLALRNANDAGDFIAGQFGITLDEWNAIQAGEITLRKIAELKFMTLIEVEAKYDDTVRILELEQTVGAQFSRMADQVNEALQNERGAQAASLQSVQAAVRKLVRIDELSPEDVEDLVDLYEPWAEGANVSVGEIRSYERRLYKVVQAHTTQADWTPDVTPALWQEIAPPATEEGEEIVPAWKQPSGAHDAYKKGDLVLFEGEVYVSTIDANTWSPAEYPQGWSKESN